MQRDDVLAITTHSIDPAAVPRRVLHLVGRVTDAVHSFLGPETTALAEQGVRQTVVMVDDPSCRHVLPQFHESVRLVLTDGRAGLRERLGHLLDAFVDAAHDVRPDATHLHGVLPLLLGVYAARFRGVAAPALFSPHGSRWIGPLRAVGEPVLRSLRPFGARRGGQRRVLANSLADARTLGQITRRPVDVIESPVPDAFFRDRGDESAVPHLAACSLEVDAVAAARVAQLAVLLGGAAPDLRVSWIGSADAESRARLEAAGVKRSADGGDRARADALAPAWVFIAAAEPQGFPVALTQAMALGLPCLAWDCAAHRDVIRHGETGLLCRDSEDALTQLVALLASPERRAELGDAARVHARARFDARRFRDSVVSAYGALAGR